MIVKYIIIYRKTCTHIKINTSQVEYFFSLFLSSECTFEYFKYLMHTKGGESCSRHGLDIPGVCRVSFIHDVCQKDVHKAYTCESSLAPPLAILLSPCSSVIKVHLSWDILPRASWDQFFQPGGEERRWGHTRFVACHYTYWCWFFLLACLSM